MSDATAMAPKLYCADRTACGCHLVTFNLMVNDGQVSSVTDTVNVTVDSNSTPVISGTPAASVVADSAYSFQPTATDADGRIR